MRTCQLSGYGSAVDTDPDLIEWNYGDYEGKTRPRNPGATSSHWVIFRDGCPNGESPTDAEFGRIAFFPESEKWTATFSFSSSGHFPLRSDGAMAGFGAIRRALFQNLGRPR